MKVHNIQADGDCLFTAVSTALKKAKHPAAIGRSKESFASSAQKLRQKMLNIVENKWESVRPFVAIENDDDEDECTSEAMKKSMLEFLKQDGAWDVALCDCLMQVMANMLCFVTVIHTKSGSYVLPFQKEYSNDFGYSGLVDKFGVPTTSIQLILFASHYTVVEPREQTVNILFVFVSLLTLLIARYICYYH